MRVSTGAAKALAPGNYRRIARKSLVAPQHVGRVLKGKRGASLEMAARIARGAGVSLDDLYAHIAINKSVASTSRKSQSAAA